MASPRCPAASRPARSPAAKPLANASRSIGAVLTDVVRSDAADSADAAVGSAWPRAHEKRTALAGATSRLALDDIRLSCRGAGRDHAFFFEFAGDGDDVLL